MPPDAFVDWQPGQPALTDVQHAGNLRAIWNRLNALFGTAGMDVITGAAQSDDGRTVTFTSSSGFTFTASLPPGPVLPAGERVVGRRYAVDELVTWQGSSYVVLLPHVASVVLADDLTARRLQLVAAKGRDSETIRGAYVLGQAYYAGDVVYTGTPGQTEVVYYKAFMDVPPDGGQPGGFPWAQTSVSPSVELEVSVEGKPGAGAILRRYAVPRVLTLIAGLVNSVATLDVAPAAAATFAIKLDGNTVATCTFAAGSRVGAFTLAQTAFAMKGQTLTVVAPATQDANASGLALTLTLNR